MHKSKAHDETHASEFPVPSEPPVAAPVSGHPVTFTVTTEEGHAYHGALSAADSKQLRTASPVVKGFGFTVTAKDGTVTKGVNELTHVVAPDGTHQLGYKATPQSGQTLVNADDVASVSWEALIEDEKATASASKGGR